MLPICATSLPGFYMKVAHKSCIKGFVRVCTVLCGFISCTWNAVRALGGRAFSV